MTVTNAVRSPHEVPRAPDVQVVNGFKLGSRVAPIKAVTADGVDPVKAAPTERSRFRSFLSAVGRTAKRAAIAGVVIATLVAGAFIGKQMLDQQPVRPATPVEVPVQVDTPALPRAGPTDTLPSANGNQGGTEVRGPSLPGAPGQTQPSSPRTFDPIELRIPGRVP